MVLDWVDGTLGSPVDGFLEVLLGEDDNVLLLLNSLESEELLVFSISPGGEHVVSNGEGVVDISVDLSVLGILLSEDVKSELVFLGGSVGVSVGGDVLDEGLFDLGGDEGVVVASLGGDSEEGGGFAEVEHCFLYLIIIKFELILAYILLFNTRYYLSVSFKIKVRFD